MKLYSFALSPNCQKVLAIAREVGTKLDIVHVEVFKGGAKSPELLAKNPNGRVPIPMPTPRPQRPRWSGSSLARARGSTTKIRPLGIR